MITGYTKPLYFLPFDHRGSYISGLFKWKEPLNVEQTVSVARSKHVIYAGFERAIADDVVPKNQLGILVDEQFGVDILRDAANKGYITAARGRQRTPARAIEDTIPLPASDRAFFPV